ncbi:MAG: hypothetical protein ACRYFK_14370 [Janthinobacterium lividum]
MKHLLLAAGLLLAGCKKEASTPTPIPKPPLEGIWEGTSIRYVEKTPAGTVAVDMTNAIAAGSDIIQITSTDFILFPNTAASINRSYIRQDTTLLSFGDTQTIRELTATKLTLVTKSAATRPPNTGTSATTYLRKQ